MLELLKELCALNSTSGDEFEVSTFIQKKLENVDCTVDVDPLGNIIVFKKGRKTPKNKIMLAAHMDEVGFVVKHINADGYLVLHPVGGIMPGVVMGRQVRLCCGLVGVIGGKPKHLLIGDEEEAQPKFSALYCDIGATSREEAEKHVSLGDFAYFVSEFLELGAGYLKGKAIDDRLGCAVMLDMLMHELEYDMHFVFTVQEEIGTRGAGCATYRVKPDMAIVLESTTACDIAGVKGEKQVCALGGGTVVSFMDGGAVYDRELYRLGFDTAKAHGLKCQTKTAVAGGNDSKAIHVAAGGVRTIALSAPTRYLHTPSCMVKRLDCVEMRILAEKMAEEMAQL